MKTNHIQNFDLSLIDSFLKIRKVKEFGIDLLEQKIKELGYLPDNPLVISKNGSYKLISGNHRLQALKRLGITEAPAIIIEGLTENEELKIAHQSNVASESFIPTTFIDDAELIWKKLDEGLTQKQLAEVLGWSRDKIKNYNALSKISFKAWEIVGTTFNINSPNQNNFDVPEDGTNVPNSIFSEGLLRNILFLRPPQQLELVKELADNNISKNKFKTLAVNYKARNDIKLYVLKHIGNLGLKYIRTAFKEINTGRYDSNWIKQNKEHIDKLISSVKDDWEEKQNTTLINGDFYEELKKLPENSIDLIITDPPYNLQEKQVFTYKDENGHKIRTDRSFKFGDWDDEKDEIFLQNFTVWIKHFKRILKDKASCYIFTSDRYISHLRRIIEAEGFKYKATLTWNKTNPGTAMVKTNYISATEYILFFTNCQSGHTFNWDEADFNNMLTHFTSTNCCGNERYRDNKNNILHPTQKPEIVIRRLIEISSYKGDMVFDGFMGVGTTLAVAKKLKRKCIGIEKDNRYFQVAKRRIEGIK